MMIMIYLEVLAPIALALFLDLIRIMVLILDFIFNYKALLFQIRYEMGSEENFPTCVIKKKSPFAH